MSTARLCDTSLPGMFLICSAVLLSGCGGGSSGSTTNSGNPSPTTSNQWTWVAGSDSPNSSPASNPSERGYATTWIGANGNLWLFGGEYSVSPNSDELFNDLWEFDPTSKTWNLSINSSPNSSGNYGTQGIPSPSNIPSARELAASWTDGNGNLLLFGGFAYDYGGLADDTGDLNDLWRFSPNTGLWTWIGGSNTGGPSGTYGTQDTASLSNIPGGRDSAGTWTDQSGKLWLFGGSSQHGSVLFNDLWQLDPSTNMWTWVSGSNLGNQAGTYNGQGTLMPGARAGAVTWMDAQGNLWLFGGFGYDANNQVGLLNDLWKFNPTTNAWTWVGGGSTAGQTGVYGTQGIPSSSNIPGARERATGWTDSSGNLWVFGGQGTGKSSEPNSISELNDLWRFNPTTNAWTWVGGSSTAGQTGVYGTQGIPSSSNIPGAREGATGWSDRNGSFWLFGGRAYDPNTYPFGQPYFSDLWHYTP
jgi:N-acetylneuraminic acid mutarotase